MPDDQSCVHCRIGAGCPFIGMGPVALWEDMATRLHRLALSNDRVWNVAEERRILDAVWHYRQKEQVAQAEMKMG